MAMSQRRAADTDRLYRLALGLFITFVSLGALAALGRVIQALFRHSVMPTTDQPS
jgi:hypothetical protein